MSEFMPNGSVIVTDNTEIKEFRVDELIPEAFSDMKGYIKNNGK